VTGDNTVIPTNIGNRERILLISSRPLEHSGMTKIEMEVIDYARESIDFEVASFDYYYEYDELLKKKKIKHYKLPEKKQMLSYMRDIYKMVRKGCYRKVYLHGNSSFMIIEALPCKIAGAKVITHCHNTKPPKGYYKYYFVKPFFNMFIDCKIGCSKEAADWAYLGKHIVINNGVDTCRFKYDPDMRKEVRRELGLTDKCIVGHIGSFNEQKNHKKLISIFEEFIKFKPNSKLLLIGDGALKNDILSDIAKRDLTSSVMVLDYVENPEAYMQAMDVMIMPSIFEGLCLVALEAQTSGLPIIVSEKFAEGTFATNNCIRMSLKDSDEEWARKAISMLNINRQDKSEQLSEKGYSNESMLKAIKGILLQ